jgi:hypothetical protein
MPITRFAPGFIPSAPSAYPCFGDAQFFIYSLHFISSYY